jgi:purine-binding chemotaxis protein CheW
MLADSVLEAASAPLDAAGNLGILDDASAAYLTFDLDGQTFAVAVQRVREILDLQPITRLPNSSHDLLGVIDVRGVSIPIVDLTAHLGIGVSEQGPETRVIVFELERPDGDPRPLGILAERVRDVCRLTMDDIETAPEVSHSGVGNDVIIGLCRRDGSLIVVVDLAQVFADQPLLGL